MPIPLVPLHVALGEPVENDWKYKIENDAALGGPQTSDFPGYDVMNFTFAADDRKWSLYVLTPTKETLKAPDGPDAEYLKTLRLAHDGTLPLQRKPFGNSWQSTGTLGSYFTWSGGANWKYRLVDTPTHPRDWPQHATNTYKKYIQMTKELAGKDYLAIDQFMINLYRPDGGLSLHPDGNTQGYIFSVTLGSPCRFKFHMSRENHLCRMKTGFPGENDEAPPGTWLHNQYTEWLANPNNAGDKMKKEAKDGFVKQISKNKSTPPVVLDLNLKHGDIIMMPGGGFQEYFWHDPTTDEELGPRINLTGRSIVVPEKKRKANALED